jgi:hypothetical protein
MAEQYLLTITVSPSLEEPLVDWLLENFGEMGFTSFPVFGHSSRTEGLTQAEQVTGRRRQFRFQIHISADKSEAFLNQLRSDFSGVGLHYWLSPLIETGRI